METQETERHTFRQRGSVALGGVCMAACLGMLALSVTAPDLLFSGFMLFGVTVPFVLLVRPSLQVSVAGVHVNNPLRRTIIPWPLVQECLARWNLQVYAGDQLVTAWAISSHVDRPRSSGLQILGMFGRSRLDMSESTPAESVSAPRMARLITEAREEWDEAIADGSLVPDGPGTIVRTWQPVDFALLALPLVVVLAGFVLG
jgi:hypothetical protein